MEKKRMKLTKEKEKKKIRDERLTQENMYKLKYSYASSFCSSSSSSCEVQIGLDECARGCFFGRTYVGAVIWDVAFLQEHAFEEEFAWIHQIRDSKKLSPAKRKLLSDKIKQYAKAWSVTYADNERIDTVNILYAVQMAFHESIYKIYVENEGLVADRLLVDGSYFVPFKKEKFGMGMGCIPHQCVPKGDNAYLSIAAASIIAKVDHDEYIEHLCERYPLLHERYGIATNMGYGTAKHIEGIETYGITNLHRKSFNRCDTAPVTMIVLETPTTSTEDEEEKSQCEEKEPV